MEPVAANNQLYSINGDETSGKFTIYSSAVHKVIVMINTGILGLLQLVNLHSSVLKTYKSALFCVLVFAFFYVVLRVRETIDVQLRPGLFPKLVGHTSHLFGGLAAIMLISVISAAFALVLLLWFFWLSTV